MTTWTELAGWTLLHFLWQGAVVVAAAGAALFVLRSASPHARYALACVTLAVMLAFPVATAMWLGGSFSGGTRSADAVSDSSWTRFRAPSPASAFPPVTAGAPDGRTPAHSVWTPFRSATIPADPAFERLLAALVVLWLCGVSVLLIRLAGGSWRIRRLQRLSLSEPASQWHSSVVRLTQRLGLRRVIHVVDSAHADTPTVIGWLRPVILLPVSAMANLTPAQVDAILAHELAHIRRHDFLVNAGQTVAETLLFYHPAVWWISSRIRTEREHCCDDVAVEICGDPVVYAEALTELAARSVTDTRFAVAATGGSLIARIRRLLRPPAHVRAQPRRPVAVSVLALALLMAGGGMRLLLMAEPVQPAAVNPTLAQTIDSRVARASAPLPTEDPRGARAWGVSLGSSGTAVRLIGFTARSLIREAYGLRDMPIVDAPTWMDDETFDLSVPMDGAPLDGTTEPDVIRAAMRAMLEAKLGLATHRETRQVAAYALIKADASGALGQNIRPSIVDCSPDQASNCGVGDSLTGFRGRHVTMGELAGAMRRMLRPLDREVVDGTGLAGTYDFTLRLGFLPIAAIGSGHPVLAQLLEPLGVHSVRSALPAQLGLTLVDAAVTREVVVIDHVDRPIGQ
jgi:uncharacterized protein (TIGR03435 family)